MMTNGNYDKNPFGKLYPDMAVWAELISRNTRMPECFSRGCIFGSNWSFVIYFSSNAQPQTQIISVSTDGILIYWSKHSFWTKMLSFLSFVDLIKLMVVVVYVCMRHLTNSDATDGENFVQVTTIRTIVCCQWRQFSSAVQAQHF